jgi:hypothetical protein
MAKYKFILEIDLDENNEKARQEFDKEMGEGACLKEFVKEIENDICDLLPYGIWVDIHEYKGN